MKKMSILRLALLAAAVAGSAACQALDSYIYSRDGLAAGSKPRDLPSQAVDLETGAVVVGLHSLDGAARARCGWYRLDMSTPAKPETFSNEVAYVSGYAFGRDTGDAHPVWSIKWRPVKPDTYSKLKLYAALVQAGLWDGFRTWLESQDLDGVNAYTAFMMAQELSSDHPLFAQWLAAAKAAMGVDDATAEAILDAAKTSSGSGRSAR